MTRPPRPGDAVIYGAGGHARELCDQLMDHGWNVRALVDDFDHDRQVDGIAVLSFAQARDTHGPARWFIAIGDPPARRRLAAQVEENFLPLGTFVSRNALVSRTARIEQGSQVFAGSVISSGVTAGRFCIVNFGCVVSHDVTLEAFATLSPGVCVAGNATVGDGAFLGIGASVRNGAAARRLRIGRDSVIGAGACVLRDVADGETVAGVPARRLEKGGVA